MAYTNQDHPSAPVWSFPQSSGLSPEARFLHQEAGDPTRFDAAWEDMVSSFHSDPTTQRAVEAEFHAFHERHTPEANVVPAPDSEVGAQESTFRSIAGTIGRVLRIRG